jgi:S1-C subfamily serine protease
LPPSFSSLSDAGLSGGFLVNRCGQVIGVSIPILPEAQSIGFVIPIDLVKAVLRERPLVPQDIPVQRRLAP